MLDGIGCKKYTKHIIPKSLQNTKMDAYHYTWTKEAYFLTERWLISPRL